MGVVNNSIKLRSEDTTLSYNYHTLLRLFGPRVVPEELAAVPALPSPPVTPPEPKREVILEPNFDAPLVPIESLVHRSDFPRCALEVFLDFHGITGVAVELVGGSLKVRSREGATLSYNADRLRKIYGPRSSSARPPVK